MKGREWGRVNKDIIIGWVIVVILNIIGWVITLILSSCQHRKNVKLNEKAFERELSVKTADETIRMSVTTIDKFVELMANASIFLEFKSQEIHEYEHTKWNSETILKYQELNEYMQKRWIDFSETLTEKWRNASSDFFKLILFMESREVILNEFVLIKNNMIESLNMAQSKFQKYRKLVFIVKELIVNSKPIEIDYTTLQTNFEELEASLSQLNDLLSKLNVKLQNCFLSAIYNYTVKDDEN